MNILNSIISKIIPGAAKLGASSQPSRPSPLLPDNPISPMDAGVNVSDILNARANARPDRLNWQHSIVDLLKVLDLDSSLKARKELAQELDYKGDMNDSAAMNTWLHQQVMNKLAENGGKIPEELKH